MRLNSFLIYTLLIAGSFSSCNKPKAAPPLNRKEVKDNIVPLDNSKEKEVKNYYCFKMEFPEGESVENRDVIELNLEITNNMVEGSYNWLPAYKDRRMGTISGILKDGKISGKYFSIQEAVTDTSNIEFELKKDEVIFLKNPLILPSGDDILKRSDCK